jgi:hypothetical protein
MGSNDEVEVDAVGSLSSVGIGSLDRVGLLGTGVQLLNPFRLVDVRPELDIGRTAVGGSKMRSLTDGKSQGGAKQVSIIVGLTLKSLLVVVLLLLRTRAGVVNGAILLLFPIPFGRKGVPTTLLLPALLVPVVLELELLLLLSYRLLIEDERRNSVSSDLFTPLVGIDGE